MSDRIARNSPQSAREFRILALGALLMLLPGCVMTVSSAQVLRSPPLSARFDHEKIATFFFTSSYFEGVREVTRTPVEIRMRDDAKLRGYALTTPRARAALIFFHGMRGIMYPSRDFLVRIAGMFDVNIVAVDYRGYGFSEGKPDLATICRDAREVFDWARDNLTPRLPLFSFGYSLGTGFALDLGVNRDVAGVILIAPFTTSQDFFAARVLWWSAGLIRLRGDASLSDYHPQPVENAARLKAPLLVIHSDCDDVIPYSLGEKLFDAAASPHKAFVVMPGVGHMQLKLAPPPTGPMLREFLDQFAGRAASDD
ncbi:MAG: alpha/beta fold hydrolase [Phycisphaerales bacterium]|nr:alpha/beta fold hydrolase [Phycisphaerales bacterium]